MENVDNNSHTEHTAATQPRQTTSEGMVDRADCANTDAITAKNRQDVTDKAMDIAVIEKDTPPTTSTAETDTGVATGESPEYLAGSKLFLAISAITLVIFLMMLDMSIIVTVLLPPRELGEMAANEYSGNTANNK